MNKLYNFFAHPIPLILGILIIILFLTIILPEQSAKAREYTPENSAFDMAFYTAPSDVYEKAAMYSESGRRLYINARWTFDLLFPLSYCFFCLTALAFTARTLFKEKYKWLLLFPVIAMLFDLFENSFVTAVMNTIDSPFPLLALGVSTSTVVKWIFVTISFGGAIIGLAVAGIVQIVRLKNR